MNNRDIKCIICGNIKSGSDEHIIPKSLGNEVLRMTTVCKECNEGLGMYVDEHLVNNFLSQIIRQRLNLKGQSKKIPNPFAKGKDSDGRDIYIDDEFKPYSPLRLEESGNEIITIGRTQHEAENAIKSKLKRRGKTESEIEDLLSKSEITVKRYQPEVTYNDKIYLDKLLLGALKIAYEYMYLTFGEQFYEDETAQKIRQVLHEATRGNFDIKYSDMGFMTQNYKDVYTRLKKMYPNAHVLNLIKDEKNQLIFNIILFNCDFLSFSICVSKNASKYNLDKSILVIIDIDKQHEIKI